MTNFSHLHVHSHYSTYDGIAKIPALVDKAIACGMPAIALTDHGNMEGVMELFTYCQRVNRQRTQDGLAPFKPIAGCEVYYGQKAYHLVLLAKNLKGYHNLCKIVSSGYQQGNFFRHKPHIDFRLMEQLHDGIICCSACIGGEIPQLILEAQSANPQHPDYNKAEDALCRLIDIFGDDFYVEIQRSETRKGDQETYRLQQKVNPILIAMAKDHDIPVIATNDPHFVNEEDADAQDCKMCIVGNKPLDDPKRIRFTRQEWLKSPEEMAKEFADIPEVLSNTQEIVDKIEWYDITAEPQLPEFLLPEGYDTASHYLIDLVLKGANERYKDTFTPEVTDRIKYELKVIREHKHSAYFLIIWDIIRAARERGIYVGPGRGAAAGSIVNYCLGITDVDPLQHGLLFERFINPDKVVMPDIDIDFEYERRNDVLDYIRQKYGTDRVMHIITHGRLTTEVAERQLKKLGAGCRTILWAPQLNLVNYQTGIHACGVVIAPKPVREMVPTACIEDQYTKQMVEVTQYDGYSVEDAGLVKFDFLDLKTLKVLKDTTKLIQEKYGQTIDLQHIPLNDAPTLQLFQSGDTDGVFLFESEGMKRYLDYFRPDSFSDLVLLNAMYRPGLEDDIPLLHYRKLGQEPIWYAMPEVEPFLKETYGMPIYQEQIIQMAEHIAGFSPADADLLRRAASKKKLDQLDRLQMQFMEGGRKNDYTDSQLNELWWQITRHGCYAFNKSHAVCYTLIAYQCAYLKAHYREEYMPIQEQLNFN